MAHKSKIILLLFLFAISHVTKYVYTTPQCVNQDEVNRPKSPEPEISNTQEKTENSETQINKTIQKYQKLLASNPTNFQLLFQLGNEFFHDQQYNEAVLYYEKALRQKPNNLPTLFNLGLTLAYYLDCLDAGKIYLEKIISINSNYRRAHFHLAKIFEKLQNKDKAITHYKKTIQLNPNLSQIYPKLAVLCYQKKYYKEAIPYFKKSIELYPENIELRIFLGNLYNELGMSNNAILTYLKAYKVDNRHAIALYNAGYSLKVKGEIDKAIALYNKALELQPDYEAAKYAIALALLYKGDFKNGWKQYEFRLINEKRNAEKLRKYIQQNDLENKHIHLIPEGGLGDTIQFIRYAQVLKKQGAYVTACVQRPLIPLISNCPYIDEIIQPGKKPSTYDDFAGIMSLPAIFESTEETIPRIIPYIFPDKTVEKKWETYFKENDTYKIGLCWEADVKNDVSRLLCAHRSIDLLELEKLSQISNITFYSLQKSDGASQVLQIPEHFVIHTFGPDFDGANGPFMDTAAIMKQLDLIITVDTSIAHLAGALGKPVWLILPYNTDWRWIAGRTDSPWYPTMQIYKQTKAFDWATVIEQIYNDLTKILKPGE